MAVKEVYRQGKTEFDGRAYSDVAIRKEISYADAVANVVRIPIEKGRWVRGVCLRVKTAFAGGTPTVTVGDLTTVNGYVKTVDISTTTLNAVVDSRQLSQESGGVTTMNTYSQGGKYYAAPDQIVVTFAAGATAGVLVLEIIIGGYSDPTADMIT